MVSLIGFLQNYTDNILLICSHIGYLISKSLNYYLIVNIFSDSGCSLGLVHNKNVILSFMWEWIMDEKVKWGISTVTCLLHLESVHLLPVHGDFEDKQLTRKFQGGGGRWEEGSNRSPEHSMTGVWNQWSEISHLSCTGFCSAKSCRSHFIGLRFFGLLGSRLSIDCFNAQVPSPPLWNACLC